MSRQGENKDRQEWREKGPTCADCGGFRGGDTEIFRIEVNTTPAKSDWLTLCSDLFPRSRAYTQEESTIYSNFIHSYFDRIKI